MKSNKILWVALIMGMALAAVVWAKPKEPPKPPVAPKLAELLGAYTAPQPQTWDDNGKKADVNVYFIDPLHFEAFKAELDAGGEYYATGSWSESNRKWDKGKTYARFAVRPDDSAQLDLCKADNSVLGYQCAKLAPGSKPKTVFFQNTADGWVRYYDADETHGGPWGSYVFENPNPDKNVYEMEVKMTLGWGGAGVGMIFGAKDRDNRYDVILRPNGQLNVWKWHSNGNSPDWLMEDNLTVPFTPKLNAVNTIKVVKTNNTYAIYFNGGATPFYTFNDTLGGNKIGYVVLTPRGAKPPFRADPVEAFFRVKPAQETPAALGLTLEKALYTYAGAQEQKWDKTVYVWFIDPLRFDEFKAELDAGGEYKQSEKYSEKRSWEKGKTFAQCAIATDGSVQLRLCKADNSVLGYRYKKK